ncbi:putative replication protein [Xanthomonas phage PBR31]|uniref:Putative replication protein n=1 Tax=Xanthomonas phage PPDBI TaxID=2723911 RepID=A0A6H0X5W3_9CAUD|nr:hypothetical protein [Ralstonia pickettii]NYS09340.1 hypothetical protein [Ralstonia pickettii]QIN95315.1 putative replication protein [Xanthomonas phage PBR31]QIW89363.1 putative replication protein [Xanthomonas phage PPDBI]
MRVKDWGKFQHFKDRRPPWIKLYRDILDDIEWHELDAVAAKVLVMIWLIASEGEDGELPQKRELAFRLRMKEKDLEEAVSKLGHWLVQDDISAISTRYQDDLPETEVETEKEEETEVETDQLSGKPDCDGEEPGVPENKADLPGGIFAYWQRVMDSPRSQLDAKRRKTIKAALKMGYSPHELCRAIRGCSLTPHNMGKNERGQKYNGIDLIFRSADQIDRFIANDSAPPKLSQSSGVAAQNDALVAAFLARDGENNADPMIIDMEH